MTRTIRDLMLAFGAAMLVAPALLTAQPRQGAPGGTQPQGRPGAMRRAMDHPGPGAGSERAGAITQLLNARRELDLTPRQVVQLDSLERIQYAEHEQFNDRMRGARDSMMARARVGERPPAARDSMRAQGRARMEAERPQMEQRRRRDSSMSAAAERILNDGQRQKVREMVAERRGFERGMRASRGGERGGMRPRRPPPIGAPDRP